MKHLIISLVLSAFAASQQPWPQQPWGTKEIDRAVAGVKTLHNMARDPDSFVLEYVGLVLGRNGYDVCYRYRARNGYGGMNREEANLTTKNEVRTGDNAWLMSPCGHHKGMEIPDITELVRARIKP
jgi:hypothetical protein